MGGMDTADSPIRGAAILAAALTVAASAACADVTLARQPVVSAPTAVTTITAPPGDPTRLFLTEKFGSAHTVRLGQAPPVRSTFLTVSVSTSGEGGLLGLAFHPGYNDNGSFWILYSAPSQVVLARGRRSASDPNIADTALTTTLTIPNTSQIHFGGWIGFGPDGFLYISVGDGGASSSAQVITNNLRGKILRIDVDGADNMPGNSDDDAFPADTDRNYSIPAGNPFLANAGDDEIWAYGFRNPWRCSFDPATGDLWIGDVGGNQQEEITVLPSGVGGLNGGWPCAEGFQVCAQPPADYHPPFAAFRRDGTGSLPYLPISGGYVIGGVVYRGDAIPCLRGQYVFGDGGNEVHSVWRSASGQPRFYRDRRQQLPASMTFAFGEDAAGELYYCAGSQLYKVVATGLSGDDCDADGSPDDCEIMQGTTQDANDNGVPDGCECDPVDFNGDGLFPDNQDLVDFLSVFGGGACSTGVCGDIDFNNDQLFPDNEDIAALFRVFGGGTC